MSLVGPKQYRRCARDMYYFSQVISIFLLFSQLSFCWVITWLVYPHPLFLLTPCFIVNYPVYNLREATSVQCPRALTNIRFPRVAGPRGGRPSENDSSNPQEKQLSSLKFTATTLSKVRPVFGFAGPATFNSISEDGSVNPESRFFRGCHLLNSIPGLARKHRSISPESLRRFDKCGVYVYQALVLYSPFFCRSVAKLYRG